ncbi:poly(A) RNA polymerase GLD2-like isoform X1 [Tachypleus tridentatus]|uniref:poly(A) RNA polymerase GLD2-like isoform X1 n=1 Tax=Tachypleus tridentatus TaxID=6853 RepID=UPI003FD08578
MMNTQHRVSHCVPTINDSDIKPRSILHLAHAQRFKRNSDLHNSNTCSGVYCQSPTLNTSRANLLAEDKRYLKTVLPGKGIKRHLEVPSIPSTSSENNESLDLCPKRKFSLSKNISNELHHPELQNKKVWDKLSNQVWDYFVNQQQSKEKYRSKMDLKERLSSLLKDKLPNLDFELVVVGSSVNGLGSNRSDMDVCLVLPHEKVEQESNSLSILMQILRKIRECHFIKKPEVIRAKVPILKFTDRISGIEVDLNINNTVGVRNTQLLNYYSRMDWRVKPLVLITKRWAKDNGINDAKNRTLSSYSLVLMVIHYLQYGCSTPVLPCLQSIVKDKFLLHSDVRSLKMQEEIPKWNSQNNQTLGELFVGFLNYYSYMFDFSKKAISVRLGCTVPKHVVMCNKSPKNNAGQWKFICIEEPFDQTNTARSVYVQLAFNKILNAFRTGLQIILKRKDISLLIDV